jgi:cardiolipin synthase
MSRHQILTVPNLLSLVRLACAPLFVWLVLGADADLAAFVLLAVLGGSDWVDGWIARRFDQGSELGKVLDPTADRVLLLTAAVVLLVDGVVPAWVAIVVLAREVLVAGATLALAAAGARRIDVVWAGKAGTLALMFALPGFMLIDLLGAGTVQDVVRFLTWCCTAGGLALSYYAAARYIPAARAALRDGRAARAATSERIPA